METSLIPGSWELASLFCKFFFYAAAASLVGGSISTLVYSDGSRRHLQYCLNYMLAGCVLGFHAVLLNFFFQVGLISDSGLAGMFDWTFITLLMDTQQGDATLLRLSGFAFAAAANIFFLVRVTRLLRPPSFLFLRQIIIFNMLGFLLLALSQGRVGHVSVLDLPARISVAVHLLAVAFWIGALLPLRQLCRSEDRRLVQNLLQRFGDHAQWIVAVLVIAGVYLVLQLLETPAELFTTAYGLALLLKLVLVLGILAIAALNRWRLVPALEQPEGVAPMVRSIEIEMGVAGLILAVTAYLSTVVGPAGF